LTVAVDRASARHPHFLAKEFNMSSRGESLDSIRRALADIEERLSRLEASGPGDAEDLEDLYDGWTEDEDMDIDTDVDQGLGRRNIGDDFSPSDPRSAAPRRDDRSRFIDRFKKDYDRKVERDGVYGGDIAEYADSIQINDTSPEDVSQKTVARYRRHMGRD
jgi:hypothetical protein